MHGASVMSQDNTEEPGMRAHGNARSCPDFLLEVGVIVIRYTQCAEFFTKKNPPLLEFESGGCMHTYTMLGCVGVSSSLSGLPSLRGRGISPGTCSELHTVVADPGQFIQGLFMDEIGGINSPAWWGGGPRQ